MAKNVVLAFFVFVGLLLFFNSCLAAQADQQVPAMKRFGQGTMTFLYCYSCGYRKAFEDYEQLISAKYPEIMINGANYDPPGLNMYLSKLVFAIKILLIVLIVSSYDVFGNVFGRATPGWWTVLLENKIYASMMIFFVANMLEGQLVSTGAFEITLNGMPIWSKLETGRIPAPQELFQIIDSHMNLVEKVPENPDFVK